MSKELTRDELKAYVLRKLGSPVIEINIAPEQLEDAVQNALEFFTEYHIDAQERTFVAVEISQLDIDNGFVLTPNNLSGISRVFKSGQGSFGETLFDIDYHITKNQIFELTRNGSGISSYFITEQYISQMNDALNFEYQYRYSKVKNILYIDTQWSTQFSVGSYLLYEAREELDPEVYNEIYGHWVVKDLATAMAKKQWGVNISKFQEIVLPGGAILNGERILDEGKAEIEEIKNEFIMKFQEPDSFMMG
jgi:hypothetical protein